MVNQMKRKFALIDHRLSGFLLAMRGKEMLTMLISLLLVGIMGNQCFASGITKETRLNTAQFWQKLDSEGNKIVLTKGQIAQFNQKIKEKSDSVYDLTAYPPKIEAQALREMMKTNVVEGTVYENGNVMSESAKADLYKEANGKSMTMNQAVRYGVVVRRSNLRTLPMHDGVFEDALDKKFDLLQETAVDPSEPVAILHESLSGAFYFVQMRNDHGWVEKSNIALTTRDKWLSYVAPDKFLVVVANKISVNNGKEDVLYQMGSKIRITGKKLNNYQTVLPTRGINGNLIEVKRSFVKNKDVHEGFLPYTKNNIIGQAFKFLDDPYGWGGLDDSVDCSSLIADIYRCVGIELPRNADEQEVTAGQLQEMTAMATEERINVLRKAAAGDVIFLNGHVMLYLGMLDDTPYIIHSLGSHTIEANGAKKKIPIMQVVVSDLSLKRYSGVSFLDALTGAISYK